MYIGKRKISFSPLASHCVYQPLSRATQSKLYGILQTFSSQISLFGYFVLLVVWLYILICGFVYELYVGFCVCMHLWERGWVKGHIILWAERIWEILGEENHVQNILHENVAFQLKTRVALRVSVYQMSCSSLIQPVACLITFRKSYHPNSCNKPG